MNRCGAQGRQGHPCRQPAGWGTHHVGEGRCKLHGGASLRGVDHPNFKHGRYEKYASQALRNHLDDFKEHDPLDLLPELTMQRTLFAEYLSRFTNSIVPSADDIQSMIMWLSDIGRTVERIVKMKNDTALTAVEVTFLAARISDVVAKYIDDPDQQRAFVFEIFGKQPVSEDFGAIAAAAKN